MPKQWISPRQNRKGQKCDFNPGITQDHGKIAVRTLQTAANDHKLRVYMSDLYSKSPDAGWWVVQHWFTGDQRSDREEIRRHRLPWLSGSDALAATTQVRRGWLTNQDTGLHDDADPRPLRFGWICDASQIKAKKGLLFATRFHLGRWTNFQLDGDHSLNEASVAHSRQGAKGGPKGSPSDNRSLLDSVNSAQLCWRYPQVQNAPAELLRVRRLRHSFPRLSQEQPLLVRCEL